MAALCKMLRSRPIQSALSNAIRHADATCTLQVRCLHSSPSLQGDDEGRGWFSKLTKPSKPDQSHSMALASKETVYEMQFHGVKPEYMEDYLNEFQNFQQLMKDKETGAELVGSFTVEIGDQDEAVHIWQYPGGYPVLHKFNTVYRKDKAFTEFRKKRNQMLRYRRNQILLAFSFWPPIQPREPSHIYELRSYTLKPGTMYEWGNCWARALQYRTTDKNEPVAGYLSHIGEQYNVHHIWAYEDLQTRKETREAAWSRPGWDEVVSYTVPLIRHMKSRILVPTPFSPLQ